EGLQHGTRGCRLSRDHRGEPIHDRLKQLRNIESIADLAIADMAIGVPKPDERRGPTAVDAPGPTPDLVWLVLRAEEFQLASDNGRDRHRSSVCGCVDPSEAMLHKSEAVFAYTKRPRSTLTTETRKTRPMS